MMNNGLKLVSVTDYRSNPLRS